MKLEDIKNKTKDAVDYLVQSLEAGKSDVLRQYLATMARFHNYSFSNVMLIARQKPEATNVAGIRAWNSLGRFVKRGEKGILILAPMVGKNLKKNQDAEQMEDAKQPESKLFGFRAVYVFDITQTEGKELPALTEVQGDVSGYSFTLDEVDSGDPDLKVVIEPGDPSMLSATRVVRDGTNHALLSVGPEPRSGLRDGPR